ncbi:hypothetical protein SAMN04488109_6323 [Chryseolinea serpens]|uniref:Uncharacterized protein n=1 Tax=Chryseolinea serpens TaxID=947013 RepID=A0A1M5XBI2_9BACT|nr:hypothetical protein [Chryseolinea serpens]SHH96864.1 hypothetical protein SAMN04488109_6323 [Chryseolinea serpens]
MTVKKIVLRTLLGLLIAFFLFIGLFVIPYFANIVMPWDRSEAIEAAITWGGLADLPDAAEDVSVGTEGSMFTRTFIVRFELDNDAIDAWIKKSARMKNMVPVVEADGTLLYEIHPGEERSIGGTVRVNRLDHWVVIKMSWS